MYSTACCTLLMILTGVTNISSTPITTLDMFRLLNEKAWVPDHRAVWENYPRLGDTLENKGNDEYKKMGSTKRSAVATALNAGRRRRQPAPALGVLNDMGIFFDALQNNLEVLASLSPNERSTLLQDIPNVVQVPSAGVLNDMGIFFDALQNNLEVLASLSPNERSTLLQDIPNVVQVPSAGMNGGGVGSGIRRLHALRPLRPATNIRSYNRRSFIEPDGGYPGANHHDPGLLWAGLGRR